MNKYSLICNYIKNNKNWETELINKKININYSKNLAIFNYKIDADFSDPIVREARGIIINIKTLDVLCWPFNKFCNYGEPSADEIDWSTASVEEKLDGSIIKYWYNGSNWQFSTNSMINAKDAPVKNMNKSFDDCIKETQEYRYLKDCDKKYTYIFELVHPDTKVLISYPNKHLYLIGVKENRTGQEINADTEAIRLNLPRPVKYPFSTLNKCMEVIKELNKTGITKEGFVIVDKDFHRIKIKTPEYIMLHHAITNGDITDKEIVELICEEHIDIEEICSLFPELRDRIKDIIRRMHMIKREIHKKCTEARIRIKSFDNNKRLFALSVKNDPYKTYMFRAIKGELRIEEHLTAKDYLNYL